MIKKLNSINIVIINTFFLFYFNYILSILFCAIFLHVFSSASVS